MWDSSSANDTFLIHFSLGYLFDLVRNKIIRRKKCWQKDPEEPQKSIYLLYLLVYFVVTVFPALCDDPSVVNINNTNNQKICTTSLKKLLASSALTLGTSPHKMGFLFPTKYSHNTDTEIKCCTSYLLDNSKQDCLLTCLSVAVIIHCNVV